MKDIIFLIVKNEIKSKSYWSAIVFTIFALFLAGVTSWLTLVDKHKILFSLVFGVHSLLMLSVAVLLAGEDFYSKNGMRIFKFLYLGKMKAYRIFLIFLISFFLRGILFSLPVVMTSLLGLFVSMEFFFKICAAIICQSVLSVCVYLMMSLMSSLLQRSLATILTLSLYLLGVSYASLLHSPIVQRDPFMEQVLSLISYLIPDFGRISLADDIFLSHDLFLWKGAASILYGLSVLFFFLFLGKLVFEKVKFKERVIKAFQYE